MKFDSVKIATAFAAAAAMTAAAAPEGYDNSAGFWVGNTLNVSPFFDISYQRDDNPNSLRQYSKDDAEKRNLKKQDEDSDTMVYKGGINFLLPGNHWRLDGRAYVNKEHSSNADVDDRTDYFEAMILKGWTDNGTSWAIGETYKDIRYDDDFELSQDDRKVFDVDGNADSAITDKSHLLLRAGYTDYNYDDDTNYDYTVLRGGIGFAHVLTDKTDWTLNANYRTYDKDSYDSNAWGVNGQIGLRTRSTEKLTFSTSVGAEYYRDYEYTMIAADGTNLGKKNKGDDDVNFVYNISGNWKMAKRLSLSVSGNSQFEPAQDVGDNSLFANTISAILTYSPGDHWKLSCGTSYEHDDYNRKVAKFTDRTGNPYTSVEKGGKDRTDNELRYFANVSYSITRYCSVFANWRYTDTNSTIDGYDYDRQRYGAGISLRY